jgi:uridine phosphorylase
MNYIEPTKLVEKRLNGQKPPDWKLAVISCRDRKGSDGLVRAFDAYPLGHTVFYGQEAFAESRFVFEANLGEDKIGLLTRCIWGGPQTAILVEELACLGVKYLIGYGSAGALDPALHLGQQVVASSAFANDGTSGAYTQAERIEADADLITMALRSGEKIGRGLTPVTAVTVESFYRESEQLVSIWHRQGAQIVNFEVSPLYAVSRSCGAKSIWLSHVSDRLYDKWEDWFWDRDKATRISETVPNPRDRFDFSSKTSCSGPIFPNRIQLLFIAWQFGENSPAERFLRRCCSGPLRARLTWAGAISGWTAKLRGHAYVRSTSALDFVFTVTNRSAPTMLRGMSMMSKNALREHGRPFNHSLPWVLFPCEPLRLCEILK